MSAEITSIVSSLKTETSVRLIRVSDGFISEVSGLAPKVIPTSFTLSNESLSLVYSSEGERWSCVWWAYLKLVRPL